MHFGQIPRIGSTAVLADELSWMIALYDCSTQLPALQSRANLCQPTAGAAALLSLAEKPRVAAMGTKQKSPNKAMPNILVLEQHPSGD
jgi:hypothetical protein